MNCLRSQMSCPVGEKTLLVGVFIFMLGVDSRRVTVLVSGQAGECGPRTLSGT